MRFGAPLEEREIEADHVPAGDDVGIELAEPAHEGAHQVRLGSANRRRAGGRISSVRRRASSSSTSSAPAPASAIESSRFERGSVSMSSERTLRRGRASGRLDLGVVEDENAPAVGRLGRARLAVDAQRPLDLTVDQVAHRETHVGLEAADAGFGEAIAQRRRSCGRATSTRTSSSP